MRQKLLFIALMAIGSQTTTYWRHYGYWGPGYGYGPYYGGYYGPGYGFSAVANLAGAAITAEAIRNSDEAYYRNIQRAQDPNKGRRAQLVGRIFDAEEELNSLQKRNASPSEITEKQEEIETLTRRLNTLR